MARLSTKRGRGADALGEAPERGGVDVGGAAPDALRDVELRLAALRGLVVGPTGETDYAETQGTVQEVFGMGANAPHLWLPATWLGVLRQEVLRLHPVAVLEVLAAVRSLGDNTLAEIREWCRAVDADNAARLAWWDDGPTGVETLVGGAAGTSSTSCSSTPMVGPLGVEVTGVETTWTSSPPCSSTSMPRLGPLGMETTGVETTGTSSPPCSSTSMDGPLCFSVGATLGDGATTDAVVGDLDVEEVVEEEAP